MPGTDKKGTLTEVTKPELGPEIPYDPGKPREEPIRRQGEFVGKVKEVSGDAWIKRKGEDYWDRVHKDDIIVEGDVIRTEKNPPGGKSRVHFRADDGSEVRIGPRTKYPHSGSSTGHVGIMVIRGNRRDFFPRDRSGRVKMPPAPGQEARTGDATGLDVKVGRPIVFRDHEGKWVARAYIYVENPGAMPKEIRHSHLVPEDFKPDLYVPGTLPDPLVVVPGMKLGGDIRWYRPKDAPTPQTIRISYRPGDETGWVREYPLLHVPAEPAPETAPKEPLWTLPAVARGATAWNSENGTAIVSVDLEITNPGTTALHVPLAFCHLSVDDGGPAAVWADRSTWKDRIVVGAGQTVRGHVSHFWKGRNDFPASCAFTFGTLNQPMLRVQLSPVPGEPPSPV